MTTIPQAAVEAVAKAIDLATVYALDTHGKFNTTEMAQAAIAAYIAWVKENGG